MSALGSPFGSSLSQLLMSPRAPGAVPDNFSKRQVLDATRDPNAFAGNVNRYRRQFGSLPVAIRAALAGGRVPSYTAPGAASGMVKGANPPSQSGPVE